MIISLHFDRRLSGMVDATSNGIPGLSYADTVRSTKLSSASRPTSVIWLEYPKDVVLCQADGLRKLKILSLTPLARFSP